MGLPLSRVLACFFLEFFSSGPFKSIIHKRFYFHYIEDTLLINPWNNDLTKIKDRLNKIELTNNLETNNT